jgi:hypothetical protein
MGVAAIFYPDPEPTKDHAAPQYLFIFIIIIDSCKAYAEY